jgi:hypothetical protein
MSNRIIPPPGGPGRGPSPAGPPRAVAGAQVRGAQQGPTVRPVGGPRQVPGAPVAVAPVGQAQAPAQPVVKRIPPPSTTATNGAAPAAVVAPTGTPRDALRDALAAIDQVIAQNGAPAAVQAVAAALQRADDHLRALVEGPSPTTNGPAAKAEDEAKTKAEDARKAALAKRYRESAGVLLRRAARADRTEEQRSEERARAEYFERRARVFEEKGFMPRELRTPREGIAGVDFFRRALASLQNSLFDLDGPEVGMLAGAVVGDAVRPLLRLGAEATPEMAAAVSRSAQLFNAWCSASEALLAALGATRAAFGDDGTMPAEPWTYVRPGDVAIDAAAVVAGRIDNQDTAPAATDAPAPAPGAQP